MAVKAHALYHYGNHRWEDEAGAGSYRQAVADLLDKREAIGTPEQRVALLTLSEALDAAQAAYVHPTEVETAVGWCRITLGPAYGYAF